MDRPDPNRHSTPQPATLEQWMNEIDKTLASPKSRAGRVNQVLIDSGEDLTQWDLACFGAEFVGAMALGLQDEDFLTAAKTLLRRLYTLHYNGMPQALGETDV